MAKNLIYDVGDTPKFGKMLIFALQQLLAILAATILVPSLIGLPTQIPAAIFGAGVGTLVYQLFTRFKSPVFLGSSFAFIDPLIAAVAFGYCGIVLGSVVAGLVYVVIAVIIKFVGTGWVNKLMPPVIIGPTVALIGLSLAGSAMSNIVKADSDAINGGYNLLGLLCGLVTFLTVVICSSQKKYQMPRLIPFVIGILTGYALASIFTVIGNLTGAEYLQIINWEPIVNNFIDVTGKFKGFEAFISFPDFAIVEAIKELASGNIAPEVLLATKGNASVMDLGGIVEIVIAFLPIAFVVFAEHIADHKNLSSIIDKDLISDPGLDNTLLGDGVGSIAGTLCGICPNTTYGESVGCVAITRNASVSTITTTAIMCMVLSFISPIMVVLQTIPSCVMGGICLALYGFIAVSGLKMFKDLDLGDNKNLFVVSAILISGIGGLVINIPYVIAEGGTIVKCISINSAAPALLIGILTNFILTRIEKSKIGKEPETKAEEEAKAEKEE